MSLTDMKDAICAFLFLIPGLLTENLGPGKRGLNWRRGQAERSFQLEEALVWDGQCVRDTTDRLLAHCKHETARGGCGGGGSVLWNNSPYRCIRECLALGYQLAGVQASDHCLCGDTSPPSSAILDR